MIAILALVACSDDPPRPPVAVVDTPPKEDPEIAAPPPPLPCPHPYLPMAEDARWEHVLRWGRTKSRVTTTMGRIEKTPTIWRAPVEIRRGEHVLRGTAVCGADGAFADLGILHAIAQAQDLHAPTDLRSAGNEGSLVPADVAPDATWTLGLATLVSTGDSMMKRATVRAEHRFRRAADEHVETPAGDYDAAHLVAESSGTEEAVLMGRTVPARTLDPWHLEIWLAPGIGEVKGVMTRGDETLEWTLTELEAGR